MTHVTDGDWQAPKSAARQRGWRTAGLWRWLVPSLLAVVAALIYLASNPYRPNIFDHFVWQAEAYLDGRFAIRWPVFGDDGNWYLHDVMPLRSQPGFGLLPFPPLPALLLVPLVAIFGVAADQSVLAAVLGGLNVGLAWLVVRRLTLRAAPALLATIFFAFGTVHWYAAMLGSTWFYAHVAAMTLLLLSILVALGGELRGRLRSARSTVGRWLQLLDARLFLAGMLLGLAALARLPVVFGFPFLLLVGGGTFLRRALSAGIGTALPVSLLLAYNLASTGQIFHPAYEYLYRFEYTPRPDLIRHDWMIEDPRYVPQNLGIMLLWPPQVRPDCGPSPFNPACPLVAPDPLAMSLLLTSPAYLLAIPLALANWRRRIVAGSALAVLAIALVNLAHFSQGWVQFGYRFSNDFAPFALLLVALAIGRLGVRPLTLALVGASVLINAWGVYWGIALGW